MPTFETCRRSLARGPRLKSGWVLLQIATVWTLFPSLCIVAGFHPSIKTNTSPQKSVIDFATTTTWMSSTESSSSSIALPETPRPPLSTFAGQVDQALLDRFGPNADRVITSWRLLEQDYVHRAYVGNTPQEAEHSHCHQEAHSYVPGLTVREFWNTETQPWCSKLASKYEQIRQEFMAVTADQARLREEGTNVWAGALSDDAAAYGRGWKTLVLMNRGMWDTTNVNLFPVTSRIVQDLKIPAVEVFFARMDPQSSIEWHSDGSSFVLTCHLGLQIPEEGCRLTIGDTEVAWENGRVLLFDTSIMHKAKNESDEERYILMFRTWHPDLSNEERQALQFIYDVLECPDLISPDPQLRQQAEEGVAAAKAFPRLKTGFGGIQIGGATKSRQKSRRKKKR